MVRMMMKIIKILKKKRKKENAKRRKRKKRRKENKKKEKGQKKRKRPKKRRLKVKTNLKRNQGLIKVKIKKVFENIQKKQKFSIGGLSEFQSKLDANHFLNSKVLHQQLHC